MESSGINDYTEGRQVYRDTVSTITSDGDRNWIYPKKPSGRYYQARTILSFMLLAFLFAAPFIRINGQPVILLNIIERKFVLFGMVFWPQDFILFATGMIALILFIVLFTAIFGRLFCGWVCPQTIFMEMLFRKIEYWIEGDRPDQIRLDRSPWVREKIIKKGLKLGIFFVISFLIANIFLAYIIGADALWQIITSDPRDHMAGLAIITVFSFVFFGVFARFREQVCTVVCPYGRLQSVLVDNNSIAVTYDFMRGEDRALLNTRKKEMTAGGHKHFLNIDKEDSSISYGDCIDCYQCVKVCPTGIDIRDGIQLECINCTACMDACDEMMVKTGRPEGLVRYASYNGVKDGVPDMLITPRIVGYSIMFTIVFSLFIFSLAIRPDAEAVILREPGMTFNELPGGSYSNFYSYKIFNKTLSNIPIEIRLTNPAGEIRFLGTVDEVGPHDRIEGRFMVFLHRDVMSPGRTPIEFELLADGQRIQTSRSVFIGPHLN